MTDVVDYEARRVVIPADEPTLASFLNLDEPKKAKRPGKGGMVETGEAKYSICLETAEDSKFLLAMRKKIIEQAVAFAQSDEGAPFAAVAGRTADSIKEALKSGLIRNPIEDGTKIADKADTTSKKREWSRGLKVINCKSQKYPPCAIIQNREIIQLSGPEQVKQFKSQFFYTGVKVFAEVDVVAYNPIEDGGKGGITVYIASVLSTGQGEKLIGGGANLAERFSGYAGVETNEDVTASDSDGDW